MNNYVYRFLDGEENIVYIGKTNNLRYRIKQHFFKEGHLKKSQYSEVKKVEYIELTSEADQHIAEIYLINKYKPIFNRADKKK